MLRLLPNDTNDDLEFTLEQLARAFDRVRGDRDWKSPIEAEIDVCERELVKDAVIWFTATVASFDRVPGRPDRLAVTAPGYARGPWGNAAMGDDFGSRLEQRGSR